MSAYGLVEFSCCVSWPADFGGVFTVHRNQVGLEMVRDRTWGPQNSLVSHGFSMRSILLDPFSLQGIVSALNKLSRGLNGLNSFIWGLQRSEIISWYGTVWSKSFNANLRVKIMQRHLFWGNTVYDSIDLSLCVWSSQSDLEPPGWWSHSLMESISLWRDRSSTRCSSTFCGIFFLYVCFVHGGT